MLTAENIKKMKQNNVSVNSDLTKQRTKDVLKTATRQQKNDIDALAGLKRVSINRVYNTGSISAKIAVAIAQTLNIDPAYLTGETTERGECNDLVLDSFLIEKGYSELTKLSAASKRPRKTREKKTSEQPAPAEQPNVKEKKKPGPKPKVKAAAETPPAPLVPKIEGVEHGFSVKPVEDNSRPHWELTEEEAVQLLRSLYLRVQFDPNGDVANTLERIQMMLV